MDDTIHPLPVYPYPVSPDDLERLKVAKLASGAQFKVQIRPAVAGSPGRVIALREPINFIADHALVVNPENAEAMLAAMKWALIPGHEDDRATTASQMLSKLGYKEIPQAQLDAENTAIELKSTDGVRFE